MSNCSTIFNILSNENFLLELINYALQEFWTEKPSLFDTEVNEESISHRIAYYMESRFRQKYSSENNYIFDCEYDKMDVNGINQNKYYRDKLDRLTPIISSQLDNAENYQKSDYQFYCAVFENILPDLKIYCRELKNSKKSTNLKKWVKYRKERMVSELALLLLKSIRPDIIFHQRKSKNNNLLLLEVKKKENDDVDDQKIIEEIHNLDYQMVGALKIGNNTASLNYYYKSNTERQIQFNYYQEI